MENELLGIGRMAARSGLTVSALRFYDGADVLTPALVDPDTGYRYYRLDQVPAARLIARLRRISLPLDQLRLILADPAQAGPVLERHRAQLAAGLAEAEREISIVHRMLERQEIPMTTLRFPPGALLPALAELRYAAGSDPEYPMLHGIFVDADAACCRLVATDRYRLASVSLANPDQLEVSTLLPSTLIDEALSRFDRRLEAELTVSDSGICLTAGDDSVQATRPDVEYPPYRRMLEHGAGTVTVDARELRAQLQAAAVEHRTREQDGTDYELSRLLVAADAVRVQADRGDGVTVAVNREFLLQALDLGDQLTLNLDGTIAPLVLRDRHRDGAIAVLMPVRLD